MARRSKLRPDVVAQIIRPDGSLDVDLFATWQRSQRAKGHDDSLPSLMQEISAFELAREARAVRQALVDLATGHWVEQTTPDGKRRVYRKSPSIAAIKELHARTLGTATNPLEAKALAAKMLTAQEQVKTGLYREQAKRYAAETERAKLDSEVYRRGYITSEDIEKYVRKFNDAVGRKVYRFPRQWLADGGSEEVYNKLLAWWGEMLNAALDEVMGDDEEEAESVREQEPEGEE